MGNIRGCAVGGYFYPSDKNELLRMLGKFIESNVEPAEAIAVMSPHAGYIYSGKTAGAVFSRVVIPETVIIMGPNHTGYGEPYAVDGHSLWNTPIGSVEVDIELADLLVKKSRYLQKDTVAHIKEHSVEVQVPFLQYIKPDVKIVPVVLSGYVDDPAWYEIGRVISDVLTETGKKKNTLIVASSDMTHYEPQEVAEEVDHYAIEAVLSLDELLLAERIMEKNISMCGYGPVITAIVAAKSLGARDAELVRYTTSAEVSGDYSQVVGYAGIVIR